MRAVVLLVLLGVAAAAASPDYVYVKKVGSNEYKMVSVDDYKKMYSLSGDYKMIGKPFAYMSPYTHGYPTFGHVPFPYSFPYTFPFTYPVVAKPMYDDKTVERVKRSAEPTYPYDDPSPAKRSAVADPEAKGDTKYVYAVVPSGIPYTGTTTYKFPSAFPATSPYSAFPAPSPYSAFPYAHPFAFPYSFPYGYPMVASPKVYKAKQEAEPEKENPMTY